MNAEELRHFVQESHKSASRGDIEGATRSLREAISYCEKAYEKQPDDFETVDFLASCTKKLGLLEDSVKWHRLAIALEPSSAALQQDLGTLLLHLSRIDEAEAPFRAAISLDPSSAALSYSGLAQILLARGDGSSAGAMFRRAYETERTPAIRSFYLGRACIHEEDMEGAVEAFRQAIAIDPKFADAHRLLGQVLQQRGLFKEAEDVLRRSIELSPRRGHSYIAIAQARKMNIGDRPFIDQMERLAAHPKVSPSEKCSLLYGVGKCLDDLGEYQSALSALDEANALAHAIFHQGRAFDYRQLDLNFEITRSLFSPEFFAENRKLGSDSETPIFIVGMMRSGTTLTEQILSCHPDIASGGELPFWIRGGLGVLDPTNGDIDIDRLRSVQNAYESVVQAVIDASCRAKVPPGIRVTDKRPGNYGVLGLIHLAFPRAKILHCTRHPVDTVLSIWMTHSALIEFGHVREDIVYAYKDYQRVMAFYRHVLEEGAMLDVPYERMVQDQEGMAREMLAFLGLPWNEACLHHERSERTVATPSVWQARQPVYNTSVGRWKNYEPWLGAFKELIPANEA